jgi:hypothetical protein
MNELPNDFFEDDEPIEDVVAAWEAAEKQPPIVRHGIGGKRDLLSNAWIQSRILLGDRCIARAMEALQDYNARRQADNLSMDEFFHMDFGISKMLELAQLHYLAASIQRPEEEKEQDWVQLPGWADLDKPANE